MRAECQQLLQATLDYWRRWISKSTYSGRWREIVNRSALALKLMIYDPTGALVAAPTMALPQDYRRTTGTTATPGSGMRPSPCSFSFVSALGTRRTNLWTGSKSAVMAPAVCSSHLRHRRQDRASRRRAAHLSGYRGCSPVWVGNGPYEQLQFDLYGAVLDAAYLYNKYGASSITRCGRACEVSWDGSARTGASRTRGCGMFETLVRTSYRRRC